MFRLIQNCPRRYKNIKCVFFSEHSVLADCKQFLSVKTRRQTKKSAPIIFGVQQMTLRNRGFTVKRQPQAQEYFYTLPYLVAYKAKLSKLAIRTELTLP